MSTKIAKMMSTNPQGAPAAEERVWGSSAAANNAKVPVDDDHDVGHDVGKDCVDVEDDDLSMLLTISIAGSIPGMVNTSTQSETITTITEGLLHHCHHLPYHQNPISASCTAYSSSSSST